MEGHWPFLSRNLSRGKFCHFQSLMHWDCCPGCLEHKLLEQNARSLHQTEGGIRYRHVAHITRYLHFELISDTMLLESQVLL